MDDGVNRVSREVAIARLRVWLLPLLNCVSSMSHPDLNHLSTSPCCRLEFTLQTPSPRLVRSGVGGGQRRNAALPGRQHGLLHHLVRHPQRDGSGRCSAGSQEVAGWVVRWARVRMRYSSPLPQGAGGYDALSCRGSHPLYAEVSSPGRLQDQHL